MTTTYRTKSGSIYEVDEDNRKIRCRARASPGGSARLPAGGPWLDYFAVEFQVVDGRNSPLWIWLEDDGRPVVTSRVVERVIQSVSEAP